MTRLLGKRRWRRGIIIAVVALLIAIAAVGAWSYWLASAAPGSNGAAAAASVQQGAVPQVSVVGAGAVHVSWAGVTLSNGVDAGGYVITRYDAATNTPELITGIGCDQVVTGRSCTDVGVPYGQWRYTVTPVIGDNWRGDASLESGAVTIAPATLDLAGSPFGGSSFIGNPASAPATGSISGFVPDEGIGYRLDTNISLSGSPASADTNGDAAGVSVAIPKSAGDGPHTVYALGDAPTWPSQASAAIVIDTTPPGVSSAVSPTPNTAGWNNTNITVSLTANDGTGVGVQKIAYTLDGTDPRTSPTAQVYTTPIPLSASATVAFYATDLTGNASAVSSTFVQIDKVPPTNDLFLQVTQGHAVLAGSTVWYRGQSAGAFTFTNAVADDNSGPASSRTDLLSGSSLGWTHVPTIVSAPAGGPYVSAPFAWMAGTSDSPSETVNGADLADNLTPSTFTFRNDSTAPSGGYASLADLSDAGYSTSRSVQVSLSTGSDSGVGLAASGDTLWRQQAPLSSEDGIADGECGSYGAWTLVAADPGSSYTDAVPDDDSCYRYQYRVLDQLGNEADHTSGREAKVETTAPASLKPTVTVFGAYGSTFIDGTTVYTNPQAGRSGGFSVDAGSPADAYSGVLQVDFPDLGLGFSDPGSVFASPYAFDYSWSGAGGADTSGAQTVTATDNAGLTSASTFTVTPDTAAPTGGALTVNGVAATGDGSSSSWSSTGHFPIIRTDYTDTGSGLASSILTVETASLTSQYGIAAGTCGVYGAPATITGSPAQSFTRPGCYRYTLTGTDNVGNTDTITAVVMVDTTPPSTPVLAVSGGTGNTYVVGSTVYTNPQAGFSGGFTVTAAASDLDSGVPQVSFPTLTGYESGGGPVTPAPFATTYAWSGATASAAGAQTVTAVNGSGLTASATFTVTPDTTAPVGGAVLVNGVAATGVGSSSYNTTGSFSVAGLSPYTDAGSGLATSTLVREQASLSANTCGSTWSNATTIAANGLQTGIASGTCYRYTLTGTDRVGNIASVSTIVKVDTTPPTGPALALSAATGNSFISGSTVYTNPQAGLSGGFTVTATTADPETGIAQVAFPSLGSGYSGGGTVTGQSYTSTYTWSGSGATATGQKTVTATNGAGTPSPGTFTVTPDSAAPTGGTLTVNGIAATALNPLSWNTSGSFTISALTDYTDPSGGSGIASSLLTVASAPLTSADGLSVGGCSSSFGAPTTISTRTLPITQTATGPTCYQYTLTGVDHVGNTVTISATVKVDTTAPTTPALAFSSITGNTYVNGTTVTINPQSGRSGGFTVTASPTDPDSGIASVIFPALTGFSTGGTATTVTTSPFSESYVWSNSVTATGTQTVTATNNAGGQSTATFTITPDTARPSISGIVLANHGTAGIADTGDTATITYSEPILEQTFCSGWSNYTAHSASATVDLHSNGSNDYLAVSSVTGCSTFHLSSAIYTGGDYVNGGFTASFTGSTIAWDPAAKTITITLGSTSSSHLHSVSGSPTPSVASDSALTDYVGNAITTGSVNGTGSRF